MPVGGLTKRLENALYSQCGIIIISFLSTVALLYEPHIFEMNAIIEAAGTNGVLAKFIAELRLLTDYWGMPYAFLWIGLYCLYTTWCRNDNLKASLYKNKKFLILLSALLFSMFSIFGKSIAMTGSIFAVFSTPAQLLMTVASLFGYTSLFYVVLTFLIQKVLVLSERNFINFDSKSIFYFVFEKHPLLTSFVLMILIEVPYWVCFYPGTAMADGLLQLTMYYGSNAMSNHHPVLSTLVMGFFNDIGRTIGDTNFGLFIYVFLQSIVQFLVFSLIMIFAKKYKVKYSVRIALLGFLTLFPALQMYSITLVKDTSFYISFFAFMLTIISYWLNSDVSRVKWFFLLLVTGLAVWMFRNNGYHIVLIGYLSLIFKDRNLRRIFQVVGLMVIIIISNSLLHNLFMPANNIAEGSIREALSIPTQQTARYCLEWQSDITDEERNVLEDVFMCSIEELGQRYNPELSNNVKESFQITPSQAQLKNYFIVWFEQFKRHPGTYIDAALAQCYGYWYPDREVFDVISYYRIESEPLSQAEYQKLQFVENAVFAQQRINIANLHQTIEKLPFIGYLYSCGLYTWLIIFLLLILLLKQKYGDCLVFLPVLASIAVNCLSPVNSYFRYQLPVVVVIPILFLFVIITIRRKRT